MRNLQIILVAFVVAVGCTLMQPEPVPTHETITRAFLAQYEPYCGQTFAGRSTFTDLGEDSPLNDANLTMIVTNCSSDEVRIRFFVEDDTSRTWILGQLEQGLRLAHDHRHADGSEYEANFYGGLAMENHNNAFRHYPDNVTSSETRLFFPADARTLSDRATREINVWSKEFDLPAQTYYYRLYLSGELRYEAAFDLNNPIDLSDDSRDIDGD
ncbi:MAG: hypothetical protein JJU41_10990 [Bacteroidetes bacterium]|nr:hypothetical protein [Bacteroidota bacterium]MCH8524493.1 hypothetical protein [Balneolales bacterium]